MLVVIQNCVFIGEASDNVYVATGAKILIVACEPSLEPNDLVRAKFGIEFFFDLGPCPIRVALFA